MSNIDKTTYFPFKIIDNRDSKWSDVRLSFDDWGWFQETYKTDTINDYYMNGYGVQGLVLASRVAAGLDACPDGLDADSEGDTCYFIFKSYELAVETAKLAKEMISSQESIEEMIEIAKKHDFD